MEVEEVEVKKQDKFCHICLRESRYLVSDKNTKQVFMNGSLSDTLRCFLVCKILCSKWQGWVVASKIIFCVCCFSFDIDLSLSLISSKFFLQLLCELTIYWNLVWTVYIVQNSIIYPWCNFLLHQVNRNRNNTRKIETF